MKKDILKLDKGLNKKLKYEITDLKKSILKHSWNTKFAFEIKNGRWIGLSKKRIIDLKTGKETIVKIFAYQNRRSIKQFIFCVTE